MSPNVGDAAPEFTATSDDGRAVSLTDLRGRWVVLFFYPKAGSAGCSVEAGRFETALPEFERRGATVIGVSADTEANQAKFRHTCRLSYPLIPDREHAIAGPYGVVGGLMGLFGRTGRATFLIDPQGRIARVWRHVNPMRHAAEVLRALDEVRGQGSA